MNISLRNRRRVARDVARGGTAISALMLIITIGVAVGSDGQFAEAATAAGAVQIVEAPDSPAPGTPLSSGASNTPFGIRLPDGAACTGDSATGGYRVQSYMVPASVDPATLVFGAAGPDPLGFGDNFAQALYDVDQNRYSNVLTAIAAGGGPGVINSLPSLSFGVFTSADVPEGDYNVGIACTVGPVGPTQLDKYWNVAITFFHDEADFPGGFVWEVVNGGGGGTTTTTLPPSGGTTSTTEPPSGGTTTTTSVPATGTTTTTLPGSTTTTLPGATTTTTNPCSSTTTTTTTTTTPGATTTTTTTTLPGATTTTTVPYAGATTTTTIFRAPPTTLRVSSGGPIPTGNSLATTGTSMTTLIVLWSVLLVVFGRIAILLGRKPRVVMALS